MKKKRILPKYYPGKSKTEQKRDRKDDDIFAIGDETTDPYYKYIKDLTESIENPNPVTYASKFTIPEVEVLGDKINKSLYRMPTLEEFVMLNMKQYNPNFNFFYPRNINPLYNQLMPQYNYGKSYRIIRYV